MNGKERILEISKKYNLSHIGSSLSAYPIIKEIHETMTKDDVFILSCGHSGIGYYVVLEENGGRNAEDIYNEHGIHATRCKKCGIACSTGSLGHGIGVAVGMALANRKRDVYCLISDGECMEGSVWEALRIANELELTNLNVWVNANGYGGLAEIPQAELQNRLNKFFPVKFYFTIPEPFEGLKAHYGRL